MIGHLSDTTKLVCLRCQANGRTDSEWDARSVAVSFGDFCGRCIEALCEKWRQGR